MDVDDKSKRWCSTKVDSHGNHIAKQHQYGHCGNNCPVQNSNSHGSGNSGNNGHGGGNSGNCPSGQTCKSFAQCASQGTSGNVQTCTLFSDGLGICCKDTTGNSGMYGVRNLDMSIRFSLKSQLSEGIPRPEMSQIKAEIILRTNVKLIFHKNVESQ